MTRHPDTPAPLLNGPFLGPAAIAEGLITAEQLRSEIWVRMAKGVYTHVSTRPDSLPTMARVVALMLPKGALLGGSAAAALHGADYWRRGDPIAVVTPRDAPLHPFKVRGAAVRITHAEVLPEDTTRTLGIPLTAPLRTAFDLTRLAVPGRSTADPANLRENVAALNTFLAVGRTRGDTRSTLFTPHLFRTYIARDRFYRWRGVRRAAAVARFARTELESPEESRLMMDLVGAGLPVPEVQYEVSIGARRDRRARLDLCYVFDEGKSLVAIEYDGEVHAQRRHEDIERWQLIRDQGVRLYVVTSRTRDTVLPSAIAEVKARLRRQGATIGDYHPRQAARLQREAADRLRATEC
ncbi:hypothetical protein [Nocardiopsis suaedae]|uniref:DUF559 domain-containing protein n=1 Tax=Nocardiopsis suaedae TaxID=3018444 RepID=A0ABT4TF49_9ACTN|nr:hypothetical protein [Nocardiopsis suaedae]MDA2803221.1 hypothetical protein [Nocardiopsis suaedae]